MATLASLLTADPTPTKDWYKHPGLLAGAGGVGAVVGAKALKKWFKHFAQRRALKKVDLGAFARGEVELGRREMLHRLLSGKGAPTVADYTDPAMEAVVRARAMEEGYGPLSRNSVPPMQPRTPEELQEALRLARKWRTTESEHLAGLPDEVVDEWELRAQKMGGTRSHTGVSKPMGPKGEPMRPNYEKLVDEDEIRRARAQEMADPTTRRQAEELPTIIKGLQRLGDKAPGQQFSHTGITFPTHNSAFFTRFAEDRPMRYFETRDVPMWDFDLPDNLHADRNVSVRSLGDALESVRRSGAGAGTMYRTPGGYRYIDKRTRATPREMEAVGGVPDKVDPDYWNLSNQDREVQVRVPNSIRRILVDRMKEQANFRRVTPDVAEGFYDIMGANYPLKTLGDVTDRAIGRGYAQGRKTDWGFEPDYEDLMQISLNPAYAARMTPKVRGNNMADYVAQPMLDLQHTPVNQGSQNLISRYHDQPLQGAMNRPGNVELFASQVADDLRGLDPKDKEAIKRFMLTKHGISLSLLAAMAGAGGGGAFQPGE